MNKDKLQIGKTICKKNQLGHHNWEYEVDEMWYVMITRKCLRCGEEQETKAGLSDDDFEVITDK